VKHDSKAEEIMLEAAKEVAKKAVTIGIERDLCPACFIMKTMAVLSKMISEDGPNAKPASPDEVFAGARMLADQLVVEVEPLH